MTKTAIVTGGSSGIGYAIAEKLSHKGYRTIITGRNEGKLLEASEKLRNGGGEIVPVVCDVSRHAEIDSLFRTEGLERLNVLVNNAGVATFAPIEETSLEDWDMNLAINLTGVFLVTRKAIPFLEKTGGHIFNLVSVAGKKGFPNCGAYSASKFGLYGFTEVLREEMRPKGIKVTAILPGATDTPIFDGVGGSWDRNKMVRPTDIAETLWLALNHSPTSLMEEVIVAPACGAL
jgi:NAD(P)-dependent dehydrogenase (short-subunit alcohol dehydrogenase family)